MRRGFAAILLVGIIATLAIVGTTIYLKQNNKLRTSNQSANQSALQSSPEARREPSGSAGTANWETADFKTWSVKYPASRFECGDGEGWSVCLTGDFSNDFWFGHWGYSEDADLGVCGKNYQECILSFREFYTGPGSFLENERERTVNGVKGIEFSGTVFLGEVLGTEKRREFRAETSEKDGFISIDQYNISPELDSIYEKILSTIEP